MTTSTTAPVADEVAQTLAPLIPAGVPLTARPAGAAEQVVPEEAFVGTHVGAVGAELWLAVGPEVTEALAEVGGLTPQEALRPALETAAQRLGAGVLGTVERRPTTNMSADDGDARFVLEADGVPHAWFTLRTRPEPRPARAALAPGGMEVLYDVEMTLTAELGRARLPIRDVLALTPGAVLELDRAAGSPADVMVNGRLVARGEIVVVDERYAVRVSEIVTPSEVASP